MNTDIKEAAAELVYNETYANNDKVRELEARVRKEQPVCYVEPENHDPLWLVSKAADIRYVESNPKLFSAETPDWVIAPKQVEEEYTGDIQLLSHMDGDVHQNHRQITRTWFQPEHIKTLNGFISETAKTYVDRMESNSQTCDFAKDISSWYPARVLLSLFGVSEEQDAEVISIAKAVLGWADSDISGTETETESQAVLQFYEFFMPIIMNFRENPDDALLGSVIANAEVDGLPIELESILGYYLLLFTAGQDTLSYPITGGLLELIKNPEQLQMLQDNPDLIPNAVDEMIRWVSPTKHFGRMATQDTVLGGQEIKKGDNLMLLFASGTRDEDEIENGDEFDVTRTINRNLAFGHGPHHCLGHFLAKTEMEIFFRELLSRLKSIELVGEPTYVESNFVSGVKSLPIKVEFK